MAEYVVKGAVPNETVLHSRTPNGYESWGWLPVREEVVRCRDCGWFKPDGSDHEHRSGWWCKWWGTDMVEPGGFCKWAVRREEDA